MPKSPQLDRVAEEAFESILAIQGDYGYLDIPEDFTLGPVTDPNYFTSRYACHDQADQLGAYSPDELGIVTGFGPTNSPTAGTLSVMLKAISLQQESGYHTTIIISDLGAWNSRNLKWSDVEDTTRKYVNFLEAIGFDTEGGCLRTHKDEQLLVVSGLIAKVLREEDFKENREATDLLYDMMSLRGDWFSVMVDGLYTVADIVAPLFHGKSRALVLAGIEEHYFPRLARTVIERLDTRYPGEFIPEGCRVGALYTKLIGGLPPYPKMSKSIPDSAINIGDSEDTLRRKILDPSGVNDGIVLTMMELVSDWPAVDTAQARRAFDQRESQGGPWGEFKDRYFEYFRGLAGVWSRA